MNTAEIALLVSVLSFAFGVFVFFKTRADLERRFLISSLPILDFTVRFEYENQNTPYLVLDVLNLHSSIAVHDFKAEMEMSEQDGSKSVKINHTGSIRRILPKEKGSTSSYLFGNHLLEIRKQHENPNYSAEALLGKRLDLKIAYSFKPAVATVARQGETINMEITCRRDQFGRHYTFAKRA